MKEESVSIEDELNEIEMYVKRGATSEKLLKATVQEMTESSKNVRSLAMPFLELLEGVHVCNLNIDQAIGSIAQVTDEIQIIDEIQHILMNKMIYAQYTLFLNNIRKAETLRKRFEEEFVYFKDSFVLVNRLKQALKCGIMECENMFLNLYKLYAAGKIEENEKENTIKKLNQLSEIMDECKYFGYFEKFENIRQVKLTELLVSHKLKSIQPSIMGRNYEKNSNYIIQLIILSLKLFEEEKLLIEQIFGENKRSIKKFLSIIGVAHELIQKDIESYCTMTEGMPFYDWMVANNIAQTLSFNIEKYASILGIESGIYISLQRQIQDLTEQIYKFIKSYHESIKKYTTPKTEDIEEITSMGIAILNECEKYEDIYNYINKEYSKFGDIGSGLLHTLVNTLELSSRNIKNPITMTCYVINNYSYLIMKLNQNSLVDISILEKIDKQIDPLLTEYLKKTWNKILTTCLNDSPSVISYDQKTLQLKSSSVTAIKKKFSDFNTQFTEIIRFHQGLKLVDINIMEDLKKQNKLEIVEKYKQFLTRYEIGFTTNKEKYYKYTTQEVEKALDLFFTKR